MTRRRFHKHRLLQAALLGALALLTMGGTMGAADNAVRYNELGHQMMCVCSCAQVLIECNHVGCPDSDGMLKMLKVSLAQGGTDRGILEAFQAKYGPTVLASPMLTPFNKVAWVVPPAVLAFGLIGAVALIRRWKTVQVERVPVCGDPTAARERAVARERIRRETEL